MAIFNSYVSLPEDTSFVHEIQFVDDELTFVRWNLDDGFQTPSQFDVLLAQK